MRTYILSLGDIQSMQRKKFRCQAVSLQQAMMKAEACSPGFFNVLNGGGQRNASIHY